MKKTCITAVLFIFILINIYSNNSTDKDFMYVHIEKGAYLKSKPLLKSKKIKYIPLNKEVEILDRTGPAAIYHGQPVIWYKVKYKNKKGWLPDIFLSNNKKLTFFGTYKLLKNNYAFLYLNNDYTFKMNVNLCIRFGEIKGKFSVEKNNLILSVISNDFKGFKDDDIKEIVLEIISDDMIKLISKNIGCAPEKDSIFIKNKFNDK